MGLNDSRLSTIAGDGAKKICDPPGAGAKLSWVLQVRKSRASRTGFNLSVFWFRFSIFTAPKIKTGQVETCPTEDRNKSVVFTLF